MCCCYTSCLMCYFCGLDYLLMIQRNVLVFVYCFVHDEDFAFICLIIFLPAPPFTPRSPTEMALFTVLPLTDRPY